MVTSIIIPVYNSKSTIERTINSCLSQTYKDIEIIVIDDGSSDGTGNIVKSIKDPRVKYYFYKNSGRSVARNRGLEKASGRYIQFLDADDTIDSEKIERAITVLENNSAVDAVQCATSYWKENRLISSHDTGKRRRFKKVLLRENLFPIHSVIFKKEIAAQFPAGLSYCEDWYFWVNTLLNSKVVFQQSYYGANVFVHQNNTMTNYRNMLLGEFYILLRIKNEVSCSSLFRDIKIFKQYINYCLKYGEKDIHKLDIPIFDIVPSLKYVACIINNTSVRSSLNKILTLKNRVLKRKKLY